MRDIIRVPLLATLGGLLACGLPAVSGCRCQEEGHAVTTPSRQDNPQAALHETRSPVSKGAAEAPASTAVATFAAGCFWGVEARFREVPGVVDTVVGYTGGHTEKPTYKQVCAGTTGHAEAVRVTYDPRKVTYEALLEVFWNCHNPTTPDRQGPDVGTQYRSAIFHHGPKQAAAARESKAALRAAGRWGEKPIVTEITPAGPFWSAEAYHQRYLEKHGRSACGGG